MTIRMLPITRWVVIVAALVVSAASVRAQQAPAPATPTQMQAPGTVVDTAPPALAGSAAASAAPAKTGAML
ncbi:MAG: hypothetical protein JWR79_879, partial [Tardiphaga sp.]|nr:hypothetical protein [Tardiphaga sp.]